jgi:hypothetical protein
MSNTTPFAATTNLRTEAETADIDTEVDSSAVLVSTYLQKGGTLKKNHRGKTETWKYFEIYDEKQYSNCAFCILCNTDIKYGKTHSTSTLDKHLERRHAEEYKGLMCERANKRLCTDMSTQKKLTDFICVKSKFEECLLKWMIKTYQPLCTVQDETFREMNLSLTDKAPTVGPDKIRSLLSDKYFDSLQKISNIVKGKNVSLTTDAWTSITKEGYVTCTLHFIEPKTWTLHHFSLGIFKKDKASTAVDVVGYAEQHMNNFGITYPQLTCVVTDTESTMIASGRLFKEKSSQVGGNTSWHGCIDHILELVTKLAFKDIPDSIGTMSACRAIVNFFNSSSQATLKLKEKSKARLGSSLNVIQDVCTRWWSTFSMCDRLLRLRNVLTVMHLEGDIRLSLTEAQWTVVQDLTILLKPFMVAQKLLEGESYVTISLIPYMIYKIRKGLTAANTNPGSSAQVQSITTLMIRKFEEEFGSGQENTIATEHLT